MGILLDVRDVKQAFRSGFWLKKAEILHGVSLQIPEKSVFGFLGANGAGKTTLIHLIVGIKTPVSGELRLNGHPTFSKEARKLIGYLPERPYFHDHLTGESFLNYFGRLSGMSRFDIQKRIPEVLEQVSMGHARKLELKRFSKGMLQRMGLAQAILHRPAFLVLDEPMSGLDPVGRKEIRELFVRQASEGRTVLFSTHIISDVEAICDGVALIHRGNVIKSGKISEMMGESLGVSEILFEGIPLDIAKQIRNLGQIQSQASILRGVVQNSDALNSALSELIQRGAKIVSVAPIRPSLEDFFRV